MTGQFPRPPAAVVLRGVAWHRFEDGVLSVTLPATFQASPRVLYVSPEELPGAEVGDKVTIRFEVDNG